MIVYHGSKSLFDSFDYARIGMNGTSEGKGFYFTDNKDIAAGYAEHGYLYTVEFNSNKSLSSDSKTITKSQFKKFLQAMDKETDYLSNWGDVEYEGYNKVLNYAVESEYNSSENDVDLICGVCNACGSIETGLIVVYELLDYDSIVLTAEWGEQDLYIALTNDIIQIIDVEQFA